MLADRFHNSEAARHIESICNRFEAEWAAGKQPRIEDMITRESGGLRKELLSELVLLEWELRTNTGETPAISEYSARFPVDDEHLREAFSRDARENVIEQGVSVRCPHCDRSIAVSQDVTDNDVFCPSCGSQFQLVDDRSRFSPGRTIGHFQLLEEIGSGAFGTVWKAIDVDLDRAVAVKIPRLHHWNRRQADMFLREARTAGQLRHRNIVSVHEVGRTDETIYIVSEFVDGFDLSEWLKVRRPSFRQTAHLMVQVAEAVDYAHGKGVVHRDLKPSNVMLDQNDVPHVMDFGLAKTDSSEITMTTNGNLLGTPAYMPPEQAAGNAHLADRRADVYSLGVVLYELLTGERPFSGNAQMVFNQILFHDPTRPRKLNPRIPIDLETVCLKCVEKSPSKRYQTAAEIADELRRHLDGIPIQARPINTVARVWRWCQRNPLLSSLYASLVLLLLVASVVSPLVAIKQMQLRTKVEKQLYSSNVKLAYEKLTVDNDVYTARDLLKEVRPAANEPFEWRYLWHLCNAPGRSIECVRPLRSIDFSSDGELMAIGSFHGGKIQLWSIGPDKQLCEVQSLHPQSVMVVRFSPANDCLLSAGTDGRITCWDIVDRKGSHELHERYTMDDEEGDVDLAVLPNGLYFASVSTSSRSRNNTIRLRHLANGHLAAAPVEIGFDAARRIAVSADGGNLAVESWGGTLRFWKLIRNGDELPQLHTEPEWIVQTEGSGNDLTFSPDGKTIASSGQIWNVEQRTLVDSALATHAYSVDFSPDGRWLAAGYLDNTVQLEEVGTSKRLIVLRGHSGNIQKVTFSPDGSLLASAGYDGTVRLWNVTQNTQRRDVLDGHESDVQTLTYSPDGSLIASGDFGGKVRLWSDRGMSLEVPEPLNRSANGELLSEAVCGLDFSPDGSKLAVERLDGSIIVWDRKTDEMFRTNNSPRPLGTVPYFHHGALSFSPLGDRLASTELDSVRITDENLVLQHELAGNGELVTAIAYSPDGRSLACGDDSGMLRIWDVVTQKQVDVPAHDSRIWALCYSRDGSLLATASEIGVVKLWQVQSWDDCRFRAHHTSRVWEVSFSPDGYTLASCSWDGSVKLWDTQSGEQRLSLRAPANRRAVSFSPNGRVLATSSGESIILLRTEQN